MSYASGMFRAAVILAAAFPAGCSEIEVVQDDGNVAAGGGVNTNGDQLASPPDGKLYFGVFPTDRSETAVEDDPTLEEVRSFEAAAGARVTWVYFSHNWFTDRTFPESTAGWIRDSGAIPFIRLMLRSDGEQDHAEPVFTLAAILSGEFDDELATWGAAAGAFGTPLLVEWGTECNGQWFSWNGVWNGGGETGGFGDADKPDGPERFAAACRYIVDVIRGGGADNITWVFHVNSPDIPDEDWNRFENYYPGDDHVDWLAISVYGAGSPQDTGVESFREQLDPHYDRLASLAADKPIIVAEMASSGNNPEVAPEQWAGEALADLFDARWPRVIGFAWWNEAWQNDDNPAHDTNLRVQDFPALGEVFRARFEQNRDRLQESPVSGGS